MRLTPKPHKEVVMTEVQIVSGAEIDIPLNKLKASPKNARRTSHSAAAIEALAASIAAKKMLQKPVVEPERDEGGTPTGFWLVTIGEGRRQAMNLLARRKIVSKACPVACMEPNSPRDRPSCPGGTTSLIAATRTGVVNALDAPCTMRQSMKISNVGARAHPMLARE